MGPSLHAPFASLRNNGLSLVHPIYRDLAVGYLVVRCQRKLS